MELVWTHMLRECDESIANQTLQWTVQSRRERMGPRDIWKASEARNGQQASGRLQLEKHGGDSTKQSWMESSGLRTVIHWD